jgi:hypothetical protein
MKAKRVVCVVKGHEWVVGRVAEKWARELVKGRPSYHNRACSRCEKEEWNADETEKAAERILMMKDRLGATQKQAEISLESRTVDPDEFP